MTVSYHPNTATMFGWRSMALTWISLANSTATDDDAFLNSYAITGIIVVTHHHVAHIHTLTATGVPW
jgi:hypothetical protein